MTAWKFIIILAIVLCAGFLFWTRNAEQAKQIIVVNGQVTVVAAGESVFSPKKPGVAFYGTLKGSIAAKKKSSAPRARKPSPRTPPCRTRPLYLAAETKPGEAESMLPLSRSSEAAWLSAEAKRAGIAGFCMEDSGPYSVEIGFLHRSRVILVQQKTPTKLILETIARASDKHYRQGSPDTPAVRKRMLEMARRFDRRFPGKHMTSAVLHNRKLSELRRLGIDSASKPEKVAPAKPRRVAVAAPPCRAKPIIRPTKRAAFIALAGRRGESKFLTPAEGMWITAEARRAGVVGFCLLNNVKKLCKSSWAGACFMGRSRVIALQPDARIKTLLHEIAHAADKDYSPDCPHRHGKSYQKKFIALARRFDRRFPERRIEDAVIREIRVTNPDYYKCHWRPPGS